MEVLYGFHPVLEALKAGRRTVSGIYVTGDTRRRRHQTINKLASDKGIPINKAAPPELARLCGTDQHQGVVARTSAFPLVNFGDLLETIQGRSEPPFLLLVDSIQDPRNLGALVRTAICVGIQAIVIPKDRAAGPLPSVSKASAGALEHMVVARVTNLARTMDVLRNAGIWIAGMDINAATTVFASDLTGPLALVVGGEEKGLRPLVKKKCDQTVVIPQTGAIDSLNASVAGAIVLYEALRQRSEGLT